MNQRERIKELPIKDFTVKMKIEKVFETCNSYRDVEKVINEWWEDYPAIVNECLREKLKKMTA